jgi:two-component system aerobic respiration control sensor histidine kinase ArcB
MKKKLYGGQYAENKSLISEDYERIINRTLKVFPGNVYWKDKKGVYLGYNDAMLKLANVNELKGKTDFDLPWKEQALFIQKNDQQVIKSKKALEVEEIITLANGQCATMLTKKTPLQDHEGNIVGILGVSIDISERGRKENETQQTAQTVLAHIIAEIPGYFYWKDKNGALLGCNKRQAQSLGFQSSAEIIGKTDFDLPWKKRDASLFRQNDLRIMKTGQTETVEETAQMDGQDVIVLSQKAPLRNELGEVIGIVGISLDITSRKMDEENSRRGKENAEFALAYVIEHLPGHIYWKDKDSVFQGCNLSQAKSAGFSEVSEMIGKSDYEMPWSKEADILRDSDLMVMSTQQELIREEISKIANSEEISTFLSRKVPFLNNKGEVIGILGVSLDITERKKMEAALHQAMIAEASSHAKSEFIANISHDLRTPLTGIVTLSDDLKDKLIGLVGEQEAAWLHESGEQLLEFCNNILDCVSADNYTEQDLKEECFDVHQLIQSIGQLEMPMIKSKGLDFFGNIDANVPSYLIQDKAKLYRILLNLLGNSIKFTEKGHIGIDVKVIEQSNNKVTLSFYVVDTGIGIKPELQEHIFERFFRVNPSYKGIYKGNGLGLYIAQRYVQLLGADRIYVESEEGRGCRFFFNLSFKIGAEKDATHIVPEQEQRAPQISQLSSSQSSQSIDGDSLPDNVPLLLLIEDNKPALRGLESMLKRAGCKFKSAEDGEKGVELAKRYDFDLIITDIGLPGISGIEATKNIRAWEKEHYKKRVPIVALTGHAAHMAEPECIQAGMDKVLTKPASFDNLKSLIQQFVAKNENVEAKNTRQLIPTQQKSIIPKMGLGRDLPDAEEELFMLDQYPYFSMKVVSEIYGQNCYKLIKDSLNLMSKQIPKDKEEIQEAFLAKNWDRVEALAHRIKGGAAYCGTVRLRYACQYLERYRKAGHTESLEKLYYQLIQVADETKNYLDQWLKMSKEV